MNILVIDDHSFLKEGIEFRIKQVLPHANCFFSSSIKSALVQIIEDKINLVFCDLEFDNDSTHDGFYFVEEAVKLAPAIKTIAFTNYNSYRIMNKARKSGFNSFLLKICSFQEFSDTLINVINSENEYISLSIQGIITRRNEIKMSLFSDSLYGISDLSEKELELIILSSETTDRQILSKTFCKSPFTIDAYYKSILQKLNIKSRKEVQFFAREFMGKLLKMQKQN